MKIKTSCDTYVDKGDAWYRETSDGELEEISNYEIYALLVVIKEIIKAGEHHG